MILFFIFESFGHTQFKIKFVFMKERFLLLFLWKETGLFNTEKAPRV
jgi:hypothetical protein